jgi:hypothetical protein
MTNVRSPYRALVCALLFEEAAGGSPPYLTMLRRAGVCTGPMETPSIDRNNLAPASTHRGEIQSAHRNSEKLSDY